MVCLGRDWAFLANIPPLQQRPAHQRDLVRKDCSQWSCRLGSSGLASDHSTGANSNLRRLQFFQSEKEEERSRAFKRLDACEFAIPSEQKKTPPKKSPTKPRFRMQLRMQARSWVPPNRRQYRRTDRSKHSRRISGNSRQRKGSPSRLELVDEIEFRKGQKTQATHAKPRYYSLLLFRTRFSSSGGRERAQHVAVEPCAPPIMEPNRCYEGRRPGSTTTIGKKRIEGQVPTMSKKGQVPGLALPGWGSW